MNATNANATNANETNANTTNANTTNANTTNANATNNIIRTTTDFINNFLNTRVEVRATPEQIQNASRLVRYGDIINPFAERCPISLDVFLNDDMVNQLLFCGHIFHQPQFNQWFARNVRCPVCRYDIRNFRRNPNPAESNPTESNPTESNPTESNPVESNPAEQGYINNDTPYIRDTVNNFTTHRNSLTNEIDYMTFDIPLTGSSNDMLTNLTTDALRLLLRNSFSDNATTTTPNNNATTPNNNATTPNNNQRPRNVTDNNDVMFYYQYYPSRNNRNRHL
jgi:hypothetical protein